MPCGGIYPIKLITQKDCGAQTRCFQCTGLPDFEADHQYFCDEWDCWIHAKCIHDFLRTAEGDIVLKHRHLINILEEDCCT